MRCVSSLSLTIFALWLGRMQPEGLTVSPGESTMEVVLVHHNLKPIACGFLSFLHWRVGSLNHSPQSCTFVRSTLQMSLFQICKSPIVDTCPQQCAAESAESTCRELVVLVHHNTIFLIKPICLSPRDSCCFLVRESTMFRASPPRGPTHNPGLAFGRPTPSRQAYRGLLPTPVG